MSPADSELNASPERLQWFTTTHWSVILSAQDTASPQAREALETLCQAYWQPLYSFIRRQGHAPADAQDLTQAFLASLLTRRSFDNVSRDKGRFRTFLLRSLKYFLSDEWHKAHAQRRGGGVLVFSLDAQRAEEHYALEPADEDDPGKIFERRWALTLLERVFERLQAEMIQTSKQDQWQRLKVYLLAEDDAPAYAQISSGLGMSVSAVKMSVSRLRQRFGELLRAEIADTVTSEQEVEAELRHLLTVVRR